MTKRQQRDLLGLTLQDAIRLRRYDLLTRKEWSDLCDSWYDALDRQLRAAQLGEVYRSPYDGPFA
jgi:hypothetical protein